MNFMSLMQGLGGKGVGDNANKMAGLLPLLGQLSPQMFGEGTMGGGLMSLLPLAQQFKQKQSAPINFLQARQDIGFNTPRGGLLDPSLVNQTGRYR